MFNQNRKVKVNQAGPRPFPELRELMAGSLFRYPSGIHVYVALGYDNVVGIHRVMLLSSGAIFNKEGSTRVDPLLPGDVVTITIGRAIQ